jgi:hypothetical protein
MEQFCFFLLTKLEYWGKKNMFLHKTDVTKNIETFLKRLFIQHSIPTTLQRTKQIFWTIFLFKKFSSAAPIRRKGTAEKEHQEYSPKM